MQALDPLYNILTRSLDLSNKNNAKHSLAKNTNREKCWLVIVYSRLGVEGVRLATWFGFLLLPRLYLQRSNNIF